MAFDLHTHHNRCGHADGSLRDYVEAALAAGLETIGFSDHSPFFGEPEDHHRPWVAMAKSDFRRYLAEAAALREEYRGRIEILIGVESDFFPEHAGIYGSVYANTDLDYVIGSVHVLGELNPLRRLEMQLRYHTARNHSLGGVSRGATKQFRHWPASCSF